MKVLDSKVLIQTEKGLTQKMGGLEIPMEGEIEVAKILEVGDEISEDELKVGDRVYIYPGTGRKFTHEGVEYRVISKSEIIVVI